MKVPPSARYHWCASASQDGNNSPIRVSETADRINEHAVKLVKGGIDLLMADRDFARFYALETVARVRTTNRHPQYNHEVSDFIVSNISNVSRFCIFVFSLLLPADRAQVPYFAYLSVLHLKETLGWWREPVLLKVHFAEAWNELHHLRIMEDLGGDERWSDRFLAQHAAVAYYGAVVVMYLLAPHYAYNLNRHVEQHAFETYDQYVKKHERWLKTQSVPDVARQYYESNDMYLYDSFHVSQADQPARRPKLESLYDVFCAIRDDEREHACTMSALESDLESTLRSAKLEISEQLDIYITSSNQPERDGDLIDGRISTTLSVEAADWGHRSETGDSEASSTSKA